MYTARAPKVFRSRSPCSECTVVVVVALYVAQECNGYKGIPPPAPHHPPPRNNDSFSPIPFPLCRPRHQLSARPRFGAAPVMPGGGVAPVWRSQPAPLYLHLHPNVHPPPFVYCFIFQILNLLCMVISWLLYFLLQN